MKIAIVNDSIYPYNKGGSEKRDWEIAKRLAKKGHEVHIFGMNDWDGERELIKDGVYIHGIGKPVARYTRRGRRSILQALYFAGVVFFPLLKEKFDILCVGNSPYFLSLSTKVISLVKRVIFFANWDEIWDYYWYEYLGKAGFFGILVERIAIKMPHKIITVSYATKEQLLKIGASENNIFIIPNGIDLGEINAIEGAKKREIDVLYVGRLVKDKNVDILVKAMKLVKEKVPDVACSIIGDGPEKERLVRLVRELNLEQNINVIGFLEKHEDVIAHMKSAKVFAFPSTREGFGIVIIEAFACGLPVIGVESIGSKCVGELIKNGHNGFLITELNEKNIAEKIIILLQDDSLRFRLSKNAQEFSRKYDWDAIADQVESLFKSCVSETR